MRIPAATTALCALAALAGTAPEDPIESARALHAQGRSEDAARALFQEHARACAADDAVRSAAATAVWKEVDPDAAEGLKVRSDAAERLAALARADAAAGWTKTAEATLELMRRLEPAAARKLELEWKPLQPLAATPETSPFRLWLGDAELSPADTPFALGDAEATIGPISNKKVELLGERMPSSYELAIDLVALKPQTSWSLRGGWLDSWTYDEIYLSFEGNAFLAFSSSWLGEGKGRKRSPEVRGKLLSSEGLAKPLRLTLVRSGAELRARVGEVEIPTVPVPESTSRGRFQIVFPGSQPGAGLRIAGMSIREVRR